MQFLERRKSALNEVVDSIYDQHTTDFWLQKINPLWSMQQALGKITKKEDVAHDMVSLTIQCNRHFKMGDAGQHHPVIVEYRGRRYERTYSLTQVDAKHVQLTVKKVAQGIVSTWLADHAKVGDVLEFGQPYGDMLIPTEKNNLVLLAAGSGITPMYSLVRKLVDSQEIQHRPVQLLYWVKTHADVGFKKYFESLAAQHPNFSFQVFYTQIEQADQRLNIEHKLHVSDVKNSTVYVCGPSGFVANAEQFFADAKLLKTEAFSLSPQSTSEIGFINVFLSKSNKTIAIPKGQSILVGLEQQNIKPVHGCRMGICNKCACNKVQGATKNLVNGAENTEPGNQLKICVNSAQSDLVIDL